jgi:hypothetical protein
MSRDTCVCSHFLRDHQRTGPAHEWTCHAPHVEGARETCFCLACSAEGSVPQCACRAFRAVAAGPDETKNNETTRSETR